MVEAAVFGADASDPDETHRLPSDRVPVSPLSLCDPAAGRRADRELGAFACELESRALARDPRMKRVRSATLQETVAEDRFWNS